MNEPITQREYEIAEKVIAALLEFNKEYEPQAVKYIHALEAVYESFGGEVEEAFTVFE